MSCYFRALVVSCSLMGLPFIQFKRDYKTVDAVIRNFEVIGEAAKNIPKNIKISRTSHNVTVCHFERRDRFIA
ncbi:HepT-like ribonuclease domain-containing protein [Alkalitalea saponilacus]|uniref:HepT-like ribonuclease domain-containing protein n=1 Tax=Alkalitalea saponilacus TaxID=889453 RepID=UPI0009A588F8|nr:hypothetical protein CDL62_02860 [Alkalitalea saponilacus]